MEVLEPSKPIPSSIKFFTQLYKYNGIILNLTIKKILCRSIKLKKLFPIKKNNYKRKTSSSLR